MSCCGVHFLENFAESASRRRRRLLLDPLIQNFASESNRVRNTTAYHVSHKKGIAALADSFEQSSGEAFQAFKVEELFADIHNESIVGTGSQEVLAKISSTAGFWQAFRGKEKSEVCVKKENLHVTLKINNFGCQNFH